MNHAEEMTEEIELNEYYQVDNDSQSMMENNLTKSGIGNDMNSMLEIIDSEQEEKGLDDITTQLMTMYDKKLGDLKKMQQDSFTIKSLNDSIKFHVTELEELRREEQEKAEAREKEIHAKRLELEELNSKKVDGIANFENDVSQICLNFIEGPQKYNSETLKQSISQLQKVLSDNISELNQYKEEMIQENDKYKQITSDDSLISLYSSFGESIKDIDALNKKLKSEVDQLLTEVNSSRLKFDLLTKLNNN